MKQTCVIIGTGNRSRWVLDGIINRSANAGTHARLLSTSISSLHKRQQEDRGEKSNSTAISLLPDIDGGQSNVSERGHNISPRKLQCVGYNVALSHPTPSGVTCNKRRDAVELET